jgi:5-methylcytosine-specific restriction endonuclease McrA
LKYPVIITEGNNIPSSFHKVLIRYGVRKVSPNKYKGQVTKKQYRALRKICWRHYLHFASDNAYGKRSSDYRFVFFKNARPVFGKYYLCTYCGRLVSKAKVEVDHLYPIGKVSKSLRLQKKLKRKGINNVNDLRNLVPSCKRCNRMKGAELGFWIIRGRIGRHPKVWLIRWMIRFSLIALIAVYVTSYTGNVF